MGDSADGGRSLRWFPPVGTGSRQGPTRPPTGPQKALGWLSDRSRRPASPTPRGPRRLRRPLDAGRPGAGPGASHRPGRLRRRDRDRGATVRPGRPPGPRGDGAGSLVAWRAAIAAPGGRHRRHGADSGGLPPGARPVSGVGVPPVLVPAHPLAPVVVGTAVVLAGVPALLGHGPWAVGFAAAALGYERTRSVRVPLAAVALPERSSAPICRAATAPLRATRLASPWRRCRRPAAASG